MPICNLCSDHQLRFERNYEPHEFIEGNRNARMWIIGLNPAEDMEWIDERTAEHLIYRFDDRNRIPKYFKQFEVVSKRIYDLLGTEQGVAHTDLVKCSSPRWPPEGVSNSGRKAIIQNCTNYLQRQLTEFSPEIIICNGCEVSETIRSLLPPQNDIPTTATNYTHKTNDGKQIVVVLSGFIGRLDNYSKRRLGAEIESLLDTQLNLPCNG
jgi:uracil-DNA glycosylase